MILLADSGSTKTDWLLYGKNGEQQSLTSAGLNPVWTSVAAIQQIIGDTFGDSVQNQQVKAVHFFGSGCFNATTCQQISGVLQKVFPTANIEVASDLLGAVKATCGSNAGITGILGTGANSCWFDGQEVVDNLPSLGWAIGDEGSGCYLGKTLIRHYFYRELPDALHQAFSEQYQLDKPILIERVYKQPEANRYLASFVPFLGKHQAHPFVEKLLTNSFEEFLVRHVFKYKVYPTVPIHFVGSVAYHFKEILLICLKKYNLQVGTILKKPIDGLATYYST